MTFLKSNVGIALLLIAALFVGYRAPAENPQTEPKQMTQEEMEALKIKQQQAEIRKIISAEPDPSLMLEPVPEAPEDKRKVAPPKPQRPMPPLDRGVASEQGLGLGGSLGAPAPKPTTASATGTAPAYPGGGAPGAGGLASRVASVKMGRLHGEAPPAPEIAVILHNKQFFPSRIRVKAGTPTKVFFTSTSDRPAAIVVEQLQVQKWLAKDANDRKPASEYDRAKFEASREVSRSKLTEITFEPRRGTYGFHDAITGAKGQIIVE